MMLRHRPERFQLRCKECLVDLALVDRHTFLDAHPNHFLPVDAELLRKLVGRQVICHLAASCPAATKKPAGAELRRGAQAGSDIARVVVVRGNQRARAPRTFMVLEGYCPRMTAA